MHVGCLVLLLAVVPSPAARVRPLAPLWNLSSLFAPGVISPKGFVRRYFETEPFKWSVVAPLVNNTEHSAAAFSAMAAELFSLDHLDHLIDRGRSAYEPAPET